MKSQENVYSNKQPVEGSTGEGEGLPVVGGLSAITP